MRADTSLDCDQVMDLASNGDWEKKCTSQENGLVNIGVEEALAATDDDVSSAKEALELYYYTRLHGADKDAFFDPSKYSAARCTPMVKEGLPADCLSTRRYRSKVWLRPVCDCSLGEQTRDHDVEPRASQ